MPAAANMSTESVHALWSHLVRRLMPVRTSAAQGIPDDPPAAAAEASPPREDDTERRWFEFLDIPFSNDLRARQVSLAFVERFPIRFARQHCVVAFCRSGCDAEYAALDVAISDLAHWPVLDLIRRHLGRDVRPLAAPEEVILAVLNAAYQQRDGQASVAVQLLDPESPPPGADVTLAGREDLLDAQHQPPVIRLVNSLLYEAIRARASDVHVQPLEADVVVRQRIDGVLFDALTIPKSHQEEVISRLKVLGRMNIAEKRLPQDGRATVAFGDRLVDLRIASLPTSHGERVVIRFLDKHAQLYTLDELGMPPLTAGKLKQLIQRDHGILLVTGPTGSGKSTTLYAALQEINAKSLNVITLEDPIEYQLQGISQTQVNPKKGLTFARGLRHVLRQDPDIIMVGEIRDQETAEMAIQSALTGHLVFSTLHTNDAASALTRLLDLGIEPYLTASSVLAVLAQRLVRKLCRHCRQRVDDTAAADPTRNGSYTAIGCPVCRHTGYQGRVGIFELLLVSDAIRELVHSRANAQRIRAQAVSESMTLLYDDGIRKMREGVTTIDEVVRVTTWE